MNPDKFRFVTFGKITYIDFFISELNRRGFPKPIAIISPDSEYTRDQRLLKPYGLNSKIEELANQNLVALYKQENVNCTDTLDLLKRKRCNVAMSMSCRDIIKRPIIDFFFRKYIQSA